jgi:chemotaxis protein histidine kinase CheA
MPDETAQQLEGFEFLRKNFSLKIKDKLIELQKEQEKLQNDKEALKSLYKMIHNISGTFGMFGFSEISEAAYRLEETLKPFVKGNIDIKPENITEIHELLGSITQQIYLSLNSTD